MAELGRKFKTQLGDDLLHRIRPMVGRDPSATGRAATPLELLYDLVYAVAFGVAAQELGHALSGSAPGPAIGAYLFAVFGVSWAWMNFTSFSSAYGNDDALFRLATIVQMIGAIIFSFGLPRGRAGGAQLGRRGGGARAGRLQAHGECAREPALVHRPGQSGLRCSF